MTPTAWRAALVLTLCLGVAVPCLADTVNDMATQLTSEEQFAIRQAVNQEMRTAHPTRTTERDETRGELQVAAEIEHRVNLLFRALDSDKDQHVSHVDLKRADPVLSQHLPGVSKEDMASFLEVADADRDQKLSKKEFQNAMADALGNVQLLETDSALGRAGLFGNIVKGIGKAVGGVVGGIKQAASGVWNGIKTAFGFGGKSNGPGDESCVYCQYIVERCETNVKQAGVIPALTGATAGPQIFLQTEQTTGAQATAQQNPFDFAAASVIGATRQATRYQRQLERQKYNEIYRVVDITLDDVCEQGMPTSLYGNCKAVYQRQSDVVDGLRYQYRPADICFRIGLCPKDSYITKGVHSRYKKK